jgi:hypothetical protein
MCGGSFKSSAAAYDSGLYAQLTTGLVEIAQLVGAVGIGGKWPIDSRVWTSNDPRMALCRMIAKAKKRPCIRGPLTVARSLS